MRSPSEDGGRFGERPGRLFSSLRFIAACACKWPIAVLAIALFSGQVQAAKNSERSKQKAAAEAERVDLQKKLDALKRDISRTAAAKESAADTLAQSEAAISDAARTLHDLAEEQDKTASKFSQLAKEQTRLAGVVDLQQRQLAKLMREQYVSGNEDRIKLLLSGDNPNRINRELQYMGYVSQAQARLIASLRTNLEAVEHNKTETQNAQEALNDIEQEQREQKEVLEKEKAKRAALLSTLSKKLASQRKEAGNLERDEQQLGGLVEKLAVLIEEQKKADAAALQKRREEKLAKAAREKAEKEKRRSSLAGAKSGASAGKNKQVGNAIDDDEDPVKKQDNKQVENELTPLASVQDGVFAALRGQLRLPVRGTIAAKFGSKRGDGPSMKGLFIKAAEGTEIKAVAGGRVVFGDWLRGFGNLIIIDHGGQYMTIYGNNQTLLKRAGDAVKAGDVIANAGNSGGNEESGLYFEMRHQGRAFDPLSWVTIR